MQLYSSITTSSIYKVVLYLVTLVSARLVLDQVATFSMASPLGADDLALQRDVWQGKVPCVFSLAPEEITTMSAEPPRSHYMLLPRHGYLPCAAALVLSHFRSHAPAFAALHDAWFEVDGGQPLKWHLPIGVLFDLHGAPRAPTLPWPIVVHFQHFPAAELLATEGDAPAAAKHRYFNSLKQMLFLKHGRAGIKWMQSLSAAEQARLWNSVAGNNVDMFLTVTRALQALPVVKLPVRVVRSGLPLLQGPVNAVHKGGCGRPVTLGDALLQLLPHMFRRVTPDADASAGGGKGLGVDMAAVEEETGRAEKDAGTGVAATSGGVVEAVDVETKVCVQGVFPPLETPVLQLCQLLCHPDAALYLTLATLPAMTVL